MKQTLGCEIRSLYIQSAVHIGATPTTQNLPIINSITSRENVKLTRLTQKSPQQNVMKKRIMPAIASLASVFVLRAAAAEVLVLAFWPCMYTT